jgi:hypothetical protein
MEPWRVYRPLILDLHHFDEELWIQISIKVRSRIRIHIKVKSRIRILIKVKRDPDPHHMFASLHMYVVFVLKSYPTYDV